MKLAERLFKTTEELWKSYLEHPFVKGIADGSLDIDRFRFFMIQDYRYLLEYSRVFAFGILKSHREDIMRRFAVMVRETLDGEMAIHKKYMARLGITPDEVKNSKTALDILVAVLSCAWSYQYIGQTLAKIPGAIENETFGEWIEGYCSEEYVANTEDIIGLVNELGDGISEERAAYLEEVFKNCGRYEYGFWDMSYNKEM